MKISVLITLLLFSTVVSANTNVAVVSLIKGKVFGTSLSGQKEELKKDSWVKEGDVVKTAEKSFAKLVFTDKSQMNIGPNSEMKIEKFSGKDSGVIDMVKGQMRSKVSKDYLQMKDKDKSKLFIKTSNAVMGVRGTDFMISTNGASTTAILFEGEIVFNKLNEKNDFSTQKLEDVVSQGVRMHPGEFSVVDASKAPTAPAILNVQQKENLEKNETFEPKRGPSNTNDDGQKKSIVPGGLDGKAVSNNSKVIEKVVSPFQDGPNSKKELSDPNGYVKGDTVRPTNGSFVHVESGVIIPPGANSVFDPNTNTYIPGPDSGTITKDGTYIPPENVTITADGKVMVKYVDQAGATKIQEIEKPKPVMDASRSMASMPLPGTQPPPPMTNDILNKSFVPGGLNDFSNFDQNRDGGMNPMQNIDIKERGKVKIDIIKR